MCLLMQFLFPNLVIAELYECMFRISMILKLLLIFVSIFYLQFYIIACLNMCNFFRLMRPLSKVETRRDSSIALYVTILNCIDE